MLILGQPQITYDDVLIKPRDASNITSRFDSTQCNPYVTESFLPVVSSPMDTIPCEQFIEAGKNRIYVIFSHRFQTIEGQCKHIRLGAQAVIGINTTQQELDQLLNAGATHVLLDVANGSNVAVNKKLDELQHLRSHNIKLWAGNIATGESYRGIARLCDFVRVGIGGGSACTTRINTGVGVGNITAIDECKVARNSIHVNRRDALAKIVADGGIRNNGDICKALAAGADLVMLGRMFAATYESAAPWDTNGPPGLGKKIFRGMASKEINEEHKPGDVRVSVEGASGVIGVTGSLQHVLNQIDANLRSSMSYVNAHNLAEFPILANLHLVSYAVTHENLPHMR